MTAYVIVDIDVHDPVGYDEYKKLAPGVERAQFLLKNFGKSGLEMGKIMDMGGDAILKANDAVEEKLELTAFKRGH